MTAPLDTQKIWDALVADPSFTAKIAAANLPLYREIVDALPLALEERLDKPVTPASFMEALYVVSKLLFASAFIRKHLVASVPAELLLGGPEEAIEQLSRLIEEQRAEIVEMFQDIEELRATGELTEDIELFIRQKCLGTLNANSLAACNAGTLTIRSLLETQPSAMLGGTPR